jgi:hydrogenase-4 membrane subunit HyfE
MEKTMQILQSLVLDVEEPILLENTLKMVIVAFSLVLLALTLSAYRKTALNKILYAALAFGLFAFHASLDFLADNVDFLKTLQTDIDVLLLVVMLAILTLFFIAIVKRK